MRRSDGLDADCSPILWDPAPGIDDESKGRWRISSALVPASAATSVESMHQMLDDDQKVFAACEAFEKPDTDAQHIAPTTVST